MSLRQKLLLMFSVTVTVSVAAVGWTVSLRVRRVFDQLDRQQTQLFNRQFQREFQHRADDTAAALDRMVVSDRLTRMAFDLGHGGEPALYLNEAAALAQEYRLSYLEILGPDGKIISSAQWTARFGYLDPAFKAAGRPPYLHEEAMPDGSSNPGLFAVRAVRSAEAAPLQHGLPLAAATLYVVGGTGLDRDLLAGLPVPAGSRVYLYRNAAAAFNPRSLTGTTKAEVDASKYEPLIDAARKTGKDAGGIVYISPRPEDSVNVTVTPLKSEDGAVLALLLLANSRRGLVEVQQHIRAMAFGVAGMGILFAIGASLWIAARVSRPIEQLAAAALEVARGQWDTHVPVHANDEVGVLAQSFNRMTSQLVAQRDQLVQSERVAAWRELARRLAHELKNPLFPLQLTVENMMRARQLSPAEFDEVFAEGAATLQSEIANLKTIIGRFSDFSKMPKPVEETIDVRDVVLSVLNLYKPALREHVPPITLQYEPDPSPLLVSADPELLRRALSNLVLNAIDAMPNGGELRAAAACGKHGATEIRISDSGGGLTPEECERLFTPYYTTKEYGTGLGLAIVQSVVADHRGKVSVESRPGVGTTFIIELPPVHMAGGEVGT